jgi:argininosuccinate synthase
MNYEKAAYSINKGLWGTSVGGKETLTSNGRLPESAYPTQLSKSGHEALSISFERGEPVAVNGARLAPVAAVQRVQQLAGPYAIGRDIHVGDTIIGIKGRVAFEAAAPVILIKAHHALEKHTLTKHQLYWKAQLAEWYGTWLHEGQLLDPVMRDIEAFLAHTQRTVTGTVHLELHPYRFTVEGVESAHDLMSGAFGQYGEMNQGWTGEDVRGFAKIFGQQPRLHGLVNAATLGGPEAYWQEEAP